MQIPTINISDEFNINEFTESKLDGKGVLDVLLQTATLHLTREFNEDRIRGTDYANAYVNLLNNFANIASQYGLAKVKQPFELQLLEADIYKTGAETVLLTKQGGLVDAQITTETAKAEMLHLEMQHKLPRELVLLDAQISNLLAEHKLKEKQLELTAKELEIKEKQLAILAYELANKLPTEVELLRQQADLYRQKVITEKAQTDDSVFTPDSVIGRNNAVLKEQAISYQNDSKIKVASVMIDTWKVRRNDDPDSAPVDDINKLADPNIGQVVTKLLEI